MNYNSVYRGIIIQNNDPDNLGRVKVFVPHISMTLYKDWNDNLKQDKFFNYPGQNLNSHLTADILKRLKEALPWTEVIQPIFGPSGSGYYHSETDHASIDGSAQPESELNGNKENGSQTMNIHSRIEKSEVNTFNAAKSTYGVSQQGDPAKTKGSNATISNDLPALLSPRGNQPNGFISIPDVGNHVWVVFENGNPSMPLIVGSIISRSDNLTNSGIPDNAQQTVA
jgi:hypothetical protein